ncbi:tyrosine-type recombinase/integrase [Isoptericola halotolerans]|uniref:tyrosine-type recombinase/integrase n=1 Tax=Isoptericola halotolerans TaxID=300560 RepID=UPI0038905687
MMTSHPPVKVSVAAHAVVFHDLRHYYALLIRHGASVKVVQARLGHKSTGETLDTHPHLRPENDRTRDAVDSAFAPPAASRDDRTSAA